MHRPHKLSQISEDTTPSSIDSKAEGSANWVDIANLPTTSQPEQRVVSVTNQVTVSSELIEPVETHVISPVTLGSDVKSLAPSARSLPLGDIPKRKSSMTALNRNVSESRKNPLHGVYRRDHEREEATWVSPRAESPVRDAVARAAQSSETLKLSPSRTFVRTTIPLYLLDDDHPSNPRVAMSVRLPSPLFVGGGTVDGHIELKVDTKSSKKTRAKPLLISRLSVDVMGVEEIEGGKRHVFLSLATELFDNNHPPPRALVHSQTPEKSARGSELYWQTQPAMVTIPFSVNLPLKTGPPPYSTRRASIRYILCPSVVTKTGETRSAIRQTWTIQILPVHDPEKALVSLPSPLLATDTLTLSPLSASTFVKLTAGLHRQTWVSGGPLFMDIHIVNNTEKSLQRIDLQLEKSVLWFLHSAAGTSHKSASHLRLPSKINTQIVSKNTLKKCKQWNGVMSQETELRTCELQIPRTHVTVGNGRYFEVRYFVKVIVEVSRNKTVSVQLPVTLIHINSLDVLPNSAMQVANSIEAKRSLATVGRMANYDPHQPYSQGQAFSNVLRQSLVHPHEHKTQIDPWDIHHLTEAVDRSPRRADAKSGQAIEQITRESDENCRPKRLSCHRHLSSRPSCYHCHLLHAEHAARSDAETGPKLPRLQVSTSGLGFTESEFEMPPDSPLRKVMLSERERHMINQQREIRVRQQWCRHKSRKSSGSKEHDKHIVPVYTDREVIRHSPKALSGGWSTFRSGTQYPSNRHSAPNTVFNVNHWSDNPSKSNVIKNRSRTGIEQKRASFNDSVPAMKMANRTNRGMRSMDWNDRTMT